MELKGAQHERQTERFKKVFLSKSNKNISVFENSLSMRSPGPMEYGIGGCVVVLVVLTERAFHATPAALWFFKRHVRFFVELARGFHFGPRRSSI